MKLILKTEVDNLGLAGDVVDVADGYGRNFLVPRGKAILATKGAMKEADQLVRARKAREASTLDDAQAQKATLEARPLRIEARVDERGHLYGSVGVVEVHRVLKERGHNIERKRIELKAVKEIGTYEVPVQVHPQVNALIEIEVVDVDGVVTLESLAAERKGPAKPEVELDEDGNPIIAEGAEGEEGAATDDVEALAQQALDAARAFEAEQAESESESEGEAAEASAEAEAADDEAEAEAEA